MNFFYKIPLHFIIRFSHFVIFLQLLFNTYSFAQPGKDGDVSLSAGNYVLNCYDAVKADVSIGQNFVTIENNCSFSCGDLVMIYQAQGAEIDATNTANYGEIIDYHSAGLYEFHYVLKQSNDTLYFFNSQTINSYSINGHVQVIKVPQYNTLTINSGAVITCDEWKEYGSSGRRKGGLVVIHAENGITLDGEINVLGKGFRAGVIEQFSTTNFTPIYDDYFYNDPFFGAEKGESIAGFGPEYDALGGRYGRGAPANGGGGGGAHNAGGGGGANGNNTLTWNGNGVMCTSCTGAAAWNVDPFVISNGNNLSNSSGGGRGGYSYSSLNQDALTVGPNNCSWGADCRDNSGGLGGRPVGNNPDNRIFFGGGGGAGDSNNSNSERGGNGGGIIYLIIPNNGISGSGSLNANGEDALNQLANNTQGFNDGGGGGGGGGSIIIKGSANLNNSIQITAAGGKGGDLAYLTPPSNTAIGPGGGGGGGFVAISSGTFTTDVSGGDNGIMVCLALSEFPANGATMGASGYTSTISNDFISFLNTSINLTSNSPICEGDTLKIFSDTIASASYQWNGPNSFSSNNQNITLYPANSQNAGTYYLSLNLAPGCTLQDSIQVIISNNPTATITSNSPTCEGGTIQIAAQTSTGNNFSWQGPNNFTSNAATITIPNASLQDSGWYVLTLTNTTGCSSTDSVHVYIDNFFPITLTYQTPVCQNDALEIKVDSIPSGQYSWLLPNNETYTQSNIFIEQANYQHNGNYTLNVTYGTNNSCSVDTTINIQVISGLDSITMPNVLSLSSSINNKFDFQLFAPNFNKCVNYTLYIYNRWGSEVFRTTNDKNNPDLNCSACFQGKTNANSNLVPGVYYYILDTSLPTQMHGIITIFE